ncbi:MAG: hypothetical protein Q9160_005101 [Pyrenula sp. 1 TL-2023]
MEYQYSNLLHPSQYETEGLCDGLPVRKHVAEDLEEIGTYSAQEDWKNLVAPLTNYKGGLSHQHSFMAVSLPECLPDRFEIVSYANEFAFLHDDVTDISNQQEADIENDDVLDAFREGARNGEIDAQKSGKRQMQAKILRTMISIDRPRALTAMRAWAMFVEQGAGRQHHHRFQTLDEYLPYRSRDVGHLFWHALATFGCAITIPEEEMSICAELVLPAVIAASLTNDLFSYEKEYEAAQTAKLPGVVNALWVLMNEHNISLEAAKIKCQTRIKDEVSKYTRILRDTMARDDLSSDLKRYVELMQYSVSGNVVWSLQCPRYHKDMQYNERQILREKHGVAKYPTTYQLDSQKKRTMNSVSSGADKQTSNASKKVRTEAHSDLLDEGIGQSISPIDPADSLHEIRREEGSWDALNLARGTALPALGEELVLEPYRYVSSLPSKGVRDMLIDGINLWLGVSPKTSSIIRSVIKMIHNSSIMLDDLQDGSKLRRGSPSAHVVFGEAQTINSATFQYVQAIAELRKLPNPLCLEIFIDEMRSLFVGQGMIIRSPKGPTKADVKQYTAQKGFCEDLDEGKFSLPLIHALAHTNRGLQLRGLLRQRRRKGHCTVEQKHLILTQMREAGSLEYVLHMLQALETELDCEVGRLERVFGQVNHEIRLMLTLLKVRLGDGVGSRKGA